VKKTREKTFVAEAGETRLDRGETLKAEEIAVERGTLILEAAGPLFAGAMSGQGKPSKVNDGPVLSPTSMRSGVMGINSELDGIGGLDSLEDSSKEFFTTVLGSPAAAAGVLGFLQAQREAGNSISIAEVPQYIRLYGVTEAAGEEAFKAFKEDFASGNTDMSDPDQFLRGLAALKQYKPAEVVWGQVKPVEDAATKNANFETWQLNTVQTARADLAKMPDGPEKSALALKINNASQTGKENALSRQEAFDSLWDEYGRSTAESLDLTPANNPRLKPYFAKDTPVVGSSSPAAIQAPKVPEESGRPLSESPVESQTVPELAEPSVPPGMAVSPQPSSPAPFSFETADEARAAIDNLSPEELSKIETIVIGGQTYANKAFRQEPPAIEPSISAGVEDSSQSVLGSVTAAYEEAKGEPLLDEEELAIGVEAIVNALTTGGMGQDDLDNLIIELQEKYTPERVKMALEMAMNQ